MNRGLILAGLAVLAFAWAGPLPARVPESFAAHMMLHMLVVGVGVPLLAIGLAGGLRLRAQVTLPVAASLIDLVVVWGWHAPLLHHAARSRPGALALEQASFALAALLVWLVAFGGPGDRHARSGRQQSALAGAMTLFFTSMHMTLLGALLALANRPLYPHGGHHDALADQQIGGAIMLAIGAVVYLAGGLTLFARVLRQRAPA